MFGLKSSQWPYCNEQRKLAELVMSEIYNINVKDIDGNEYSLSKFEGKLILIVNVASECGLTGQYSGLQSLYEKYHDQGLVILGFPCNQFGAQEPGSEIEIIDFCTSNYGVSFPMMSKVEVNGSGKHTLYEFLTGDGAMFPGEITWNFEKFIVDKEGEVASRFSPRKEPLDTEILDLIEKLL